MSTDEGSCEAGLLYGKLSQEQQEELGKLVVERLRSIIGGYGELSVLAEYIAVMLQSNRPPDQISTELEAFLQDQSRPFTEWLCDQLNAMTTGKSAGKPTGGEALLAKAVRDVQVRPQAASEGSKKRKEKGNGTVAAGDGGGRAAVARERSGRSGDAAAATVASPRHHRSRSRRRRHRTTPGETGVAGEARTSRGAPAITDRRALAKGRGASPPKEGPFGPLQKAVLTPNVQFLREQYHSKDPAAEPEDGGAHSRWHFRAEPGPSGQMAPMEVGPPPSNPAHGAPMYDVSPFSAGGPHPSHLQHHEVQPDPRPPRSSRNFAPKKWRVILANTVVRATEHLDSKEVQKLQEGEIVEQVTPAFTLSNGIIRIQIRHPSSPSFPLPIGWITQDATAAGGPKFLEPGPEPIQRSAQPGPGPMGPGPGPMMGPPWRPPGGGPAAWAAGPPSWRPRGPPPPRGPAPPITPRGPNGFQNLVWKPGAAPPE